MSHLPDDLDEKSGKEGGVLFLARWYAETQRRIQQEAREASAAADTQNTNKLTLKR